MFKQKEQTEQYDRRRAVVIVAIGTKGVEATQTAKEILRTRYQLENQFCKVHYLLIDTDSIAEGEDHTDYEQTYRVRLADEKGVENMREYKKTVLTPNLDDFQSRQLLPPHLTTELLEHPLFSRSETKEANKNPLKGYFYLLANLRVLHNQIKLIKTATDHKDRSIYIVYSPVSGTAAGTWFLITSLIFQEFQNASPVLINLMPSQLEGEEEHKNRNYAIFGWSARLLETMVHKGVTLRWTLKQTEQPPITVRVDQGEPLFVLLQSAYRNRGDTHLKIDEFFQVVAELLCLCVIGKQNALGPPSVDSQITNTETDQRMDEWQRPERPTRRFASRGYCAVRYNARQAKEVTRLGVKDAFLRALLSGARPNTPPSAAVQTPDTEPLTPKALDTLRGEWHDYVRQRVRKFYREHHETGYIRAYAEPFPTRDLDLILHTLSAAYRQDLLDSIANLRGDGTDESPLRRDIWEVLQGFLNHFGFAAFPYLESVLASLRVDAALILQQIPDLAAQYPSLDEAIEVARKQSERYRKRVALRGQQLNAEVLERSFKLLLEQTYTEILLEVIQKEYADLLNDAVQYFAVELQYLKQRLEALYEENWQQFEPHARKLREPLGAYLDERTYAFADEKIARYSQKVSLIIREFFQGLTHRLDSEHLGLEQLSVGIDDVILHQEGITSFPSDLAAIVRQIAATPNLLSQLLHRGRALTRLRQAGYERNWGIWHSGPRTDAMKEALGVLQQSISNLLSNESFKVVINDGSLPLRAADDMELVLAETVLDFPLIDVQTDKSMEEYWQQDEAFFNNGTSASVHRVHPELVTLAPLQSHRFSASAPTQQTQSTTDERQRRQLAENGEAVLLWNRQSQRPDGLSDEDLEAAAERLGIPVEEIKSRWEAFNKREIDRHGGTSP